MISQLQGLKVCTNLELEAFRNISLIACIVYFYRRTPGPNFICLKHFDFDWGYQSMTEPHNELMISPTEPAFNIEAFQTCFAYIAFFEPAHFQPPPITVTEAFLVSFWLLR